MDSGANPEKSGEQPPPYAAPPADNKPAYPPSYPQPGYPAASYPTASYPTASYPTASYPTGSYPSSGVTITTSGVSVGLPYGAHNNPLSESERPPTYLVWSIINIVFCCFWIGIAAIMKSRESQSAAMMGNRTAAIAASESARTYNILSTVLGVVFLGGYIGFLYWYVTTQILVSSL